MQAYLPGAGWIDFDPTNSIVGNRDLIRVAVAWDAKEVLPLRALLSVRPRPFWALTLP
jgi:transglutaminase-like putative cysteine protease